MKFEKVLDKAKKLHTLVERGEMGEAKAAKRDLENLCDAWGIDVAQLFDEKKHSREFRLPYNDPFARDILFQCYCKVTNQDTIDYSHNQYKNKIWFELTDAQYIDLNQVFAFYLKQWKKERRQLMKDMLVAFINKHNLFSANKKASDEPMTPEKWKKIMRMQQLMSQLEDVSYHKQLE